MQPEPQVHGAPGIDASEYIIDHDAEATRNTAISPANGPGLEHIEELPVMDFKNRSIAYDAVTSMDINKAIQRSLTKACARHGLGLYIYAGEDLPDGEEAAPVVEHPKKNVRDEIARIKGKYGPDGFKQMRESLIAGGIVKDIPSTQMQEADWWALIVAIDQNFGDAA